MQKQKELHPASGTGQRSTTNRSCQICAVMPVIGYLRYFLKGLSAVCYLIFFISDKIDTTDKTRQ